MPRLIRTSDGTWHFVGEHSCGRFNRQDVVEEATFHESEYDATPRNGDAAETEHPPGDYENFCPDCYRTVERWQNTRDVRIQDFVLTTDVEKITWDHDQPRRGRQGVLPDCGICGKNESGSEYSDDLGYPVCTACSDALMEALVEYRAEQAAEEEDDESGDEESETAPASEGDSDKGGCKDEEPVTEDLEGDLGVTETWGGVPDSEPTDDIEELIQG